MSVGEIRPNRNRLALPILGVFGVVALFAYLVGLNALGNLVKGVDVSEELRRVVRDERRPRVRIADLTEFEWDLLYLYGGYQYNDAICADLSLTWWECTNLPPEADYEGVQEMVFLFRGRLAHSEMGSIYDGHIQEYAIPLTPATAVFDVKQEGTYGNGDPRYVLRRAPKAAVP